MFAYAMLMIFGPSRMGEIVWNKSGTWGVYEVDENDSNTHGIYDSVSLWAISKDGKTCRHLLAGRYSDQRETQLTGDLYVYPVIEMWAPDDRHVLFFKQHAERSGSYGNAGAPLFDVDALTGEVRKLTQTFMQDNQYSDDRIGVDRTIAFSPDGKKLLLVLGSGPPYVNKRIALLDYVSLKRTWLTNHDVVASSPSWSPDGSRIVFASMPAELPSKQVTADMTLEEELIARMDYQRIWIMNADGTGAHQLTKAGRTASYPIWQKSGRIEFLHNDEEVWSILPDGSDLRLVRPLDKDRNMWVYGVEW